MTTILYLTTVIISGYLIYKYIWNTENGRKLLMLDEREIPIIELFKTVFMVAVTVFLPFGINILMTIIAIIIVHEKDFPKMKNPFYKEN